MSLVVSGLDRFQPSRILVTNSSGSSIPALRAVKMTSAGSSYPNVQLSDSNPVLGITSSSILSSQVGIVTTLGIVEDVDTSAWPFNTLLYAGADGVLQTNYAVLGDAPVAIVLKQDLLGSLFVIALSTQYDLKSPGALNYKGTLDASSGSYPLSPTTGDLYIISVAGYIESHYYHVGDWAVYNGTGWDYVDNAVYVNSVNGKVGTVVLEAVDIPYDPSDDAKWPVVPTNTQEALDYISNQIAVGDTNVFAGYDANGHLSTFSQFKIEPNVFFGSRWSHYVVPSDSNSFDTLHNIYTNFNPDVPSKQGWNHFFIEAGIGTDNSGNQFGDWTDVKSTLVLGDITYTSKRRGTDGDVITIEYVTGAVAGEEVVTNPSLFQFVVQIEDGVSTADQIKAALDQFGPFTSDVTATITGNGSNPQLKGGPYNLSGGVNDEGGITLMGLSAFSRNASSVGFINGYQSYLDFGNGEDEINAKSFTAFGGNATIHDNAKIGFMGVLEYGLNVGDNNSGVLNDFRGVNIYGNLGQVGQGVNAFNFSPRITQADYINVVSSSFNVTDTLTHGVNVFADFSQYQGYIGDNYFGLILQPDINSVNGFFGVNINPRVTHSRGYSTGLSVNMQNVNLDPGVKGEVTIQDLTFQAREVGTGINNYQMEFTDDGIAGSETITLSGTIVTVHMESGVSTASQIKTAMDANIAIASNIATVVTGIASNAQVATGPTYFTGGADGGSKRAAWFNGGVDVQGKLTGQALLDTSVEVPDFTYGLNNVGGQIRVASGFPIDGGQFGIGNNFGIQLQVEDDVLPDSSGLGLGFNMVGALSQISVTAGKTMDSLNFFSAGASVPDQSGSVTSAVMFRALGLLPQGGNLDVTNMYGLKVESTMDAIGADNTWGVYVDSVGDNYFAGSINIGNPTKKVTNSSIALEIGSQKGLGLGRVTTAQRDAMVAVPGMIVFNTDTSLFEGYNGTFWVGL